MNRFFKYVAPALCAVAITSCGGNKTLTLGKENCFRLQSASAITSIGNVGGVVRALKRAASDVTNPDFTRYLPTLDLMLDQNQIKVEGSNLTYRDNTWVIAYEGEEINGVRKGTMTSGETTFKFVSTYEEEKEEGEDAEIERSFVLFDANDKELMEVSEEVEGNEIEFTYTENGKELYSIEIETEDNVREIGFDVGEVEYKVAIKDNLYTISLDDEDAKEPSVIAVYEKIEGNFQLKA